MSLNKTLDRLFDEIRREAKRNPDFADRLDAALRLHASRRDVAEGVIDDVAADAGSLGGASRPKRDRRTEKNPTSPSVGAQPPADSTSSTQGVARAPDINPAGMYSREGEEALAAALAAHDLGALRALVAEHNLDPSGVTAALTRDELAQHVVVQAKRRTERDEKMFDY